MPSTSVHFSESLLDDLDHFASERGLSRNRLIVEACRETLQRRKEWPEIFFDDFRFRPEDLEELRSSSESFEKNLSATRRNRDASPF